MTQPQFDASNSASTSSSSPRGTPTSIALVKHPLLVRRCNLVGVCYQTPHLARVTLRGAELAGFRSLAPDDHIKVIFPKTGESNLKLPELINGRILWTKDIIARDYTPVHYNPVTNELCLEIVMHENGHATAWVKTAKIGDALGIAGPRGSHVIAGDLEYLVLIGDETALPAIRRWLSELPPSTTVSALVQVASSEEEVELPTRATLSIQWVHRNSDDYTLESAVRAAHLLTNPSYVWVAGEASEVKNIRKHLTMQRGVQESRLSARGYWKRGVLDHQEPHDD